MLKLFKNCTKTRKTGWRKLKYTVPLLRAIKTGLQKSRPPLGGSLR